MGATDMPGTARRNVTVQGEGRSTRHDGQCNNKNRVLNSVLHEVAPNLTATVSWRLETGAYSKPVLHKNKGFFNREVTQKKPPGPYPWLLHSR